MHEEIVTIRIIVMIEVDFEIVFSFSQIPFFRKVALHNFWTVKKPYTPN